MLLCSSVKSGGFILLTFIKTALRPDDVEAGHKTAAHSVATAKQVESILLITPHSMENITLPVCRFPCSRGGAVELHIIPKLANNTFHTAAHTALDE